MQLSNDTLNGDNVLTLTNAASFLFLLLLPLSSVYTMSGNILMSVYVRVSMHTYIHTCYSQTILLASSEDSCFILLFDSSIMVIMSP